MRKGIQLIVGCSAGLFSGSVALADLDLSYQFQGNGNWSIDSIGGNTTPVGTLQAVIPAGSTVERAFLYSATIGRDPASGGPRQPTVNFDGQVYDPSDFTFLGSTAGGSAGIIQAYRTDVTAQVASALATQGTAAPLAFVVQSEDPTNFIDGEVLAVVYSNPAEAQRTIAFLEGVSDTDGDSFTFNAAQPLPDPTTSGFEALLSLGISFSTGTGGQVSHVDVNGRRLTSSAGGFDDGQLQDGALITAGGVGDSPDNPATPTSEISPDDELYNLALGNAANPTPFISAGDTSIVINTANPSDNDNIFFAGFNITAEGVIPEPSGLGLLAAGGLLLARRTRRAR